LQREQFIAETKVRQTSGALSQANADRIERLAGTDLKLAQQELAKLSAEIAATTQRTQIEGKLATSKRTVAEREATSYTIPNPLGGPPIKVGPGELTQYLSGIEQRKAQAREHLIDNVRQARAAEATAVKDNTTRLKTIADAETAIVGTKTEFKESAVPWMDVYNKLADSPYVWIYFPEDQPGLKFFGSEGGLRKYSESIARVEIPPDKDGKRCTASQIYEAAQAMPGGPLTVRQYLEQVYYPKRLNRKPPWQP
jgi:hypothetical protein